MVCVTFLFTPPVIEQEPESKEQDDEIDEAKEDEESDDDDEEEDSEEPDYEAEEPEEPEYETEKPGNIFSCSSYPVEYTPKEPKYYKHRKPSKTVI